MGGGNIVNCVCARVFYSTDFAPLVSKIALEVQYGQFTPRTCFTGIELFRGENIPYFVCAKLFFSADFAPLVSKIALEVHYGQLWGGF